MRVAVLGGTYDPPHFGHLLVARQVLEKKSEVDEVWLMPANTNPDKQVFALARDRLAMARLLEEPGIRVSDLDIRRGGETYTVDTIRELVSNKNNSYIWLMGSDLLPDISKWEGFDEFVKLIPFIIFPRPDYPIRNLPEGFEVLSDGKLLTANYSSTAIRKRVFQGKSIKGLTPESVAQYIKDRKLYQQRSVYV